MSDIFREIDEEVRQERYLELWKKYGNYVIALFVAVVIAVGGWQAWKYYQATARMDTAERYDAAIVASDPEARVAWLGDLAAEGDGYGTLAAFEQASALASEGRLDEAFAAWDVIIKDSSDPVMRDLALVQKAQWSLGVRGAAEIESELLPAADPEGAFAIPALEILALTAIERGDRQTARERLQAILDEVGAPLSARQRASQILSILQE